MNRIGFIDQRLASLVRTASFAAFVACVVSPRTIYGQADLLTRARTLLADGQLPAAAAAFRDALRADSTNAAAWSGLAAALHRQEQYPDALSALDRALAIDPRSVGARFNRALTLSELGDVARAKAELDSVIALRPTFAPAWTERGAANALIGRMVEAHEDWGRSLALDTTYVWARFYRAQSAFIAGRYRDAADDFDAVLRAETLLSAHLWRWLAYRFDARTAPALSLSDTAWPGPIARFLEGQMSASQLLTIADQQRIPLDERRRATALAFIGHTLALERRYPEAREALGQAVRLAVPRHADILAAQAQLNRLEGQAVQRP